MVSGGVGKESSGVGKSTFTSDLVTYNKIVRTCVLWLK